MSKNPAVFAALVAALAQSAMCDTEDYQARALHSMSDPMHIDPPDFSVRMRRDRGHPLNPGKARRK